MEMMLAVLLTAGCQDEINTSDNTTGQPDALNGYVKVSINMPSTVGTRAAGNYDNGGTQEYQVNDAYILFFNGTDETTATFLGAYDLQLSMNNANTGDSQISATSDAYIMEAPIGTESALVIINPDKTLLELDGTTHVLNVDGTPLTTSSTLAALQGVLTGDVTTFTGIGRNNFTMTNAPLSDKNGQATDLANAKASTLAAVNVYESRTQADAASADHIYVERVVAKVSMGVSSSILDNTVGDSKTVILDNTVGDSKTVINVNSNGQYSGDKVTLEGWALNVTNKTTKLVRDVTGFSTWVGFGAGNVASRFVENNPVKTNAGKYRINWAVDNNYNTAAGTDLTTWSATNQPTTWNTSWTTTGSVDYCLENTFDVNHMNHDQTTQVLIKSTYQFGNAANESFVVVEKWNIGAISTNDFIARLKQNVTALADKEITINADAEGGYYNKTGYKMLGALLTVQDYTGTDLNAVIDALGTVKFYKNGATYYSTALIRHFGEDETPWDNGGNYTEAKHLGRYGVVRNTWYQLTINGIAGPGEPEIPAIPSEPDDQQEAYIKVQVNILAWAIRQNDVNL